MLYLQTLDLFILNLYTSTPNPNSPASPMPSTSPTMDILKLNVKNV